jgi:hypothetical protein
MQALWEDLPCPNATRAHPAAWRLAAGGADVVQFISKRLEPVPAMDPKKVAALFADLDADDPDTRERAGQELAKLADLAQGALLDAQKNPRSAEVRRRVELLLKRLDEELLLAERAPLLLEKIGTTEAKQLLQRLAGGAESARLTRSARAAFERLNR